MNSTTLLGVFAKYWEAGKVKTRLAEGTSDQFAAELYQAFILTTLERVSGIATSQMLCVTPADKLTEFALVSPPNWTIATQAEGDLGVRMQSFFQQAIEHQFDKTILIGTDSPTLPASIITQAYNALDNVECVIGPANDGGYYLIGCQQQIPPVFESIDWSTSQVLAQTISALDKAEVAYELLPPWFDVDTIDDLKNLRDSFDDSSQWLVERLHHLEAEHLV